MVDFVIHLHAVVHETKDVTNYTNLYVKSFPADWDEAKLKEDSLRIYVQCIHMNVHEFAYSHSLQHVTES